MNLETAAKTKNISLPTFIKELENYSIRKETPKTSNSVLRDSDHKWILNNLAKMYGIKKAKESSKQNLISKIIQEEHQRKLVTNCSSLCELVKDGNDSFMIIRVSHKSLWYSLEDFWDRLEELFVLMRRNCTDLDIINFIDEFKNELKKLD